MVRRVEARESRPKHGDRAPSDPQRRAMGRPVDSPRSAAHDGQASPSQLACHSTSDIQAVGGGGATSDHRDGPRVGGTEVSEEIERGGRIGNQPKKRGVVRIVECDERGAGSLHGIPLQARLRRPQRRVNLLREGSKPGHMLQCPADFASRGCDDGLP